MMKRKAFTLLELLIVLAVITIIGTMTFGVIGNISASNKKLNCSTNLAQIYGAARLYAQDYDGNLPYYNPTNMVTGQPVGGIGLWALWIYPNGNSPFPITTDSVRTGYLRNQDKFHCPADQINLDTEDAKYLSYQGLDDVTADYTYRTFREDQSRRQLRYFTGTNPTNRRVSDSTIITWCRYHRRLNNDGTTYAQDSNRDNVLFFDGRVQSLPVVQNVIDTADANGTCQGWQRVPLQVADSLTTPASACKPAN